MNACIYMICVMYKRGEREKSNEESRVSLLKKVVKFGYLIVIIIFNRSFFFSISYQDGGLVYPD